MGGAHRLLSACPGCPGFLPVPAGAEVPTLEAEENAWTSFRAAELGGQIGVMQRKKGLFDGEEDLTGPQLGVEGIARESLDDVSKGKEFREWVDGLLNVSVPIILAKKALRSKEAFSCGGSHVVKFKFYKDLKAISHLPEVLPERDPVTLPGKPLIRKYESCAVVGNSGSLLETQFGDGIDKHEVVIRFNAAKTEGYEQFVGYKTTFRILNSVDMKASREGNEISITTLRNNDLKEWAKQSLIEGNPTAALTTDPEFLCHTWAWVRNRGDKPSSGLVGIVMALKMCEKVDIYGFQYSNYFSRFSRPHYYDWERPKKGREKVHPFTREVSLYAQLARNGYLKVW
eukprot:CAMPEP_0196590682 /NCGR_PEP_ID=MMETSP1081-20130531/67230_1 /TAXON_ID=36882 /ORGANISM="Pyramimonas amylifera, Strain CCMP720" /LENGTH=342 /DNA_ID=CAMNT_0041913837 /DNA_START=543 /DNA_END=1572 /DNA_ORIENTATION=+